MSNKFKSLKYNHEHNSRKVKNTEKPPPPTSALMYNSMLFSRAYEIFFCYNTDKISGKWDIWKLFKIFATYFVHGCSKGIELLPYLKETNKNDQSLDQVTPCYKPM